MDNQSCSYTVCWDAFKRLLRDFSPTEQADLFHNTAARPTVPGSCTPALRDVEFNLGPRLTKYTQRRRGG